MPLYLTEQINKDVFFVVWKLTEDVEKLLQIRTLSEEEHAIFSSLKNNKRKREWLTIRILLESLFGKNFKLEYLSNGKPTLINPKRCLSIAHSSDFVTICVSNNKNIGIDIEKIRENIGILKEKFLLLEELQTLDHSDNLLLHIYWGGKEALYKMYSSQHPLFTKHLSLYDINYQEGSAKGRIKKGNFSQSVHVIFRQIENNLLACCFEDYLA